MLTQDLQEGVVCAEGLSGHHHLVLLGHQHIQNTLWWGDGGKNDQPPCQLRPPLPP